MYFNTASNVLRLYFNSQWNSLHNVTASYGLSADYIDFSLNPISGASVARLQWSDGEGTLTVGLKGGNVNLDIGQEQVAYCYNGTGSAMPKGTVVYISGAQGQRPSITKATSNAESTSTKVLGMTAEQINNGAQGFVATFGIIQDVNTASYAPGTQLWLSSTPGEFTSEKIYAPNHLVFLGYSIKQSANAGQIFLSPQNGLELFELHNVSASNPNNNDFLFYNSSASIWQASAVQAFITTASVGFANRSASSTISSSATVATHAGTASSIAGSLVTGTVASATVASHAGTASSINASLITGTTLPAAIVNSSLTSLGTLSNLTVSGSLNVDSGTLFVDATNNEVGILTTSPASALHVVGGALVTGNLSASGTLFSGSAILGGTNGLYLGLGDGTYAGTASGAAIQLASYSAGTSRAMRFYTPNSSGNNALRLFISDNNTSVWSDLLISPTFSVRSNQLTASTEVFGVNTSTGLSTASFLSVTGSTAITGNLNVDSGTLFVDSANNEVGIGTSTPASALHVVGGAYITGAASFGGTVAATSTTQAAGTSNTQLATTEFVSRVARYSAENLSVSTSSVAGFFVIDVTGSRSTSLNGIIFMGRGTASRLYVGQINTGINGAASAGYARGYVENNAGTALAIGTTVPLYYIAW
jgi:hypothetical protein